MHDEEYLTVEQVASYLGVSTRTVYRCVADGTLNKPIKVGKRTSRWSKREIINNEFTRYLNKAPEKKKKK